MRTILIRMRAVSPPRTLRPVWQQQPGRGWPQTWGWTLSLGLLLVGCAGMPTTSELALNKPVVLLGEVHDNAAQHALRLRAFEALLAGGARPALALEQFDRNRQADILSLIHI